MMFPKTVKDWNRFSKWMMALSLLFVVFGGVFAIRTYVFLQSAVPATGTIVKLIEKKSDGDNLYAPVFTFQDANDKTHKVFSSTASFPPIGDVGDQIEVLYDPRNPNHAEEDKFFNLWGIAAIPAGLGIFYLIVFWIVVVITKRKMDSANKALESDVLKATPQG